MNSKRDNDRTQALPTVLTIGHSMRTIEAFIRLLQAHAATRVADVRTVPRSRYNPQFNRDTLPVSLKTAGIDYAHMAELGGLRHLSLSWEYGLFARSRKACEGPSAMNVPPTDHAFGYGCRRFRIRLGGATTACER